MNMLILTPAAVQDAVEDDDDDGDGGGDHDDSSSSNGVRHEHLCRVLKIHPS